MNPSKHLVVTDPRGIFVCRGTGVPKGKEMADTCLSHACGVLMIGRKLKRGKML